MYIKNYILTSDRLVNETMEMVEYFYNKYNRSSEVIVLGYKNPTYVSEFVKFESLGIDTGPYQVCSQLYDYFSKIEDKYFILEVDDKPIIRNMNLDIIDLFIDMMEKDDKIGRCGLTLDNTYRDYNFFYEINGIKFYKNNQNTRHKNSATNSIWKKEYFIKYLTKYNNLWEWEVDPHNYTINDEYKIIGSIPSCTDFTHLYKKGTLIDDWFTSPHTNDKLVLDDFEKIKKIYNI
jgi:hypothetical protein